jgi:hypothetical protein
MDQPLDLDAIQARCDTATPGPWWNDGHEIYQGEHAGIPAVSTWIGETCTVSLPDYGDANGAFLANARQDVPALLARVRELEAENAELRETLDDCDCIDNCRPPEYCTTCLLATCPGC